MDSRPWGLSIFFLTTIIRRYIITLDDISSSVNGGGSMSENSQRSALTEAVFYILLSLYSPLHGYGIMQNIKELSNGRVNLGPEPRYGPITTLWEKTGMDWKNVNFGKKTNRLTHLGRMLIKNVKFSRLKDCLAMGNGMPG